MTQSQSSGTSREEFAESLGDAGQRWTRIAEQSARVSAAFWERQADAPKDFQLIDPTSVSAAFSALTASLMSNPDRLAEVTADYWRRSAELWSAGFRRMQGTDADLPPMPADRRFRGEAWEANATFDYLRRSYLLAAEWMHGVVESADIDPEQRRRAAFYTRQFLSAASPANFAATNPEVLKRVAETDGKSLIDGLEHLLEDLEKGKGQLKISMTDEAAFEVGRNVAATPGKVVFQNDMMQLIQYAPSTDTVARRPLLFVPPWINKYYVMDLQPRNSLIRWTVEQGHTLFVISWVNPDASLAGKSFADYMHSGPLAALDAIEKATGEREVNVLGFCIGGILNASTLAWMAAQGDDRIQSATFLATMFDFGDVGETAVFVDEAQVARIEQHAAEKGYLEGRHLANMFSLMRENDLVWSFVVNNYLMGRGPIPFDLLFWNADSTHLPATMLTYYLRHFYLENGLVCPGHVILDGVPIDLGKIQAPCYVFATKEDHIAPWPGCFAGTRLIGGPVEFVLGGSGHIAGVINPPKAKKYGYWTSGAGSENPDAWLDSAERHDGSWWEHWGDWLSRFRDEEVPARHPGDGALDPIEDAPGSYVKQRAPE